ncbi:MAG TPA: choice-of-anchor Q domain-containing protein [Thermoleophilaceae bacterium]
MASPGHFSAPSGHRFQRAAVVVALSFAALWFAAPALADTITVNTSADTPMAGGECSGVAGDCSLRQAINKSASGGTVSIPASIGTIKLVAAHTAININKDLTIVGAGAGTTVIDGQTGGIRLFVIAGNRTVTFSGLTLTGGDGADGAAIHTDGGSLTLSGVAVTGNTSGGSGSAGNGVVEMEESSGPVSADVEGSTFSSNHIGGGGAAGSGTGVLDMKAPNGIATLTIAGSTFSGNAVGGGGGAGNGGAIDLAFTKAGSSLTVTGSVFSGNTAGGGATGSGPSSGAGNGGAIEARIDNGGSMSITGSSFVGNIAGGKGATGDGSGRGAGGAVDVDFAGAGTLAVDHSTFSGNSAGGAGGGGVESGEGFGGAISAAFSDVRGALSVTNSSFGGNAAGGAGGAAEDSGIGGGGGLDVSSTNGLAGTIAASTFSSNRAGGDGGASDGAGSGIGGGLLLGDGDTAAVYTLTDDTVTGNTGGGSIGSMPNTGLGSGAGAEIEGATTSLVNDTIDANSSGSATGSIGGGIDDSSSPMPAVISAENTIVSGNTAAGVAGNCPHPITSAGNNIEDTSPSQCGFAAAGLNPLLGPLQDNGGPTPTQALLPGSPAINAGAGTGCPGTDQRGVARPQGAACDIGAYEVAPPSAVTGSASAIKATSAMLGGSAANPDAVGASVVFQFGKTTSYGASSAAQSLGAGAGGTGVAATITGLKRNTTYHFREVVSNPDGTSAGADKTFKTAFGGPTISKLAMHPSKLVPASGRGASFTKAAKTGAKLSYRDSQKATTTFTVQRPARGFRSGKRCVAHKPKGHKKATRCTFYKSVGSFTHKDKSGANHLHFTGRVKHRPLKHGHYRLQAVAKQGKTKGRAVTVKFRVV